MFQAGAPTRMQFWVPDRFASGMTIEGTEEHA